MDELKKLYNVHLNVMTMLECRGVPNVHLYRKTSETEFKTCYYTSNIDTLINTPGKNIMVKFVLTSKIKPNQIKEIINTCKENHLPGDHDKLILIVKPKPLCNILKIIKEREYKFTEIFWINVLTFNIMNHIYVPTHIKATEEEVAEIMERERITSKAMFPIIHRTDPIARFLDLRSGDVCKIIRTSPTSGVYTAYRVVK
jgi:DNA-directed RNA polymerase I, II, and III subunit RPABC1